jgi:hypothetical protein
VVQTLPVAPCPAAGGGLLCFDGDVCGWLGQFLLGLALLSQMLASLFLLSNYVVIFNWWWSMKAN